MPPRVTVIISCKRGRVPETVVPLDEDLEILIATGTNVSQQRNLAVRRARGELLYFLDDDSHLSAASLALALQVMDGEDWAAVGGPSVTRAEAVGWERLFGAILCSRAAALNTRARNCPVGSPRPVGGQELVTCNLLIRRCWFERLGGFDETLHPGEDVEFMRRLHQSGGRICYHPAVLVERPRRQNLAAFLWQYFRYGWARGVLFVNRRPVAQWVFGLPLLLWLCLPLFLWGRWLYALVCLIAAIEVTLQERRLASGLCALGVVPAMHLVYGLGISLGLVQCGLGLPMNRPDPDVEIEAWRPSNLIQR